MNSKAIFAAFVWVMSMSLVAGCNLPEEPGCFGPKSGIHDDTEYEIGESFQSDCNTCTCEQNGQISCTAMACVPTCEFAGHTLLHGEQVPDPDGCGTCICQEGEMSCSDTACPQCEAGGQHYDVGDTFPGEDGCSTCTCMDDGSVQCTAAACACEPEEEWYRDYVGDAEECGMMAAPLCPEHTTYFSNACGCGCEMSQECPAGLNCMPGGEIDDLCNEGLDQCPYTQVAH